MNDTIYRQDAIDALNVLCQEHRYRIPSKRETYSPYNEAWQDALDRAEGAIFNLPSAQPERMTAKWVKTEIGWKCSNCTLCTNIKGKTEFKYCPNCGCRMEGDEHE